MNRSRFLLALVLGSFLTINSTQWLLAKDFPEGSPKFLNSYKDALAEGEKTGKPVIVVFSATWCGPCQAMKKSVYPSKEVQPFHDKFVWAYLDVDDDANEKASSKHGVSSIPHIEIVDGKGKSLGQQIGSSDPGGFVKKLEAALKASPAPAAKK